MKTLKRVESGHLGESIAAAILKSKGYTIMERNWRTPYGEIDLIARQSEVIVFVEVKTRSSKSLGPPEISVTNRKAQHMRNAAEYYIQQHPDLSNDWRIDLLTIQFQPNDQPALIDHFENVLAE